MPTRAAVLAAWLVSLAPAPAGQMRSVWDGVYTVEQAQRGAALYQTHCASCHGVALTGAEAAPALTGFEFRSNWSGLPLGELFERLRSSMPPEDPGQVSARDKVDVLAHLLAVGGLPAGPAELARDALAGIRFEATKP
ncbi:MAG: c-type cytochrome [Acidimicrobiia bacterium]|nr:c-type cytochrome [Acidimicrobiia bacterium]